MSSSAALQHLTELLQTWHDPGPIPAAIEYPNPEATEIAKTYRQALRFIREHRQTMECIGMVEAQRTVVKARIAREWSDVTTSFKRAMKSRARAKYIARSVVEVEKSAATLRADSLWQPQQQSTHLNTAATHQDGALFQGALHEQGEWQVGTLSVANGDSRNGVFNNSARSANKNQNQSSADRSSDYGWSGSDASEVTVLAVDNNNQSLNMNNNRQPIKDSEAEEKDPEAEPPRQGEISPNTLSATQSPERIQSQPGGLFQPSAAVEVAPSRTTSPQTAEQEYYGTRSPAEGSLSRVESAEKMSEKEETMEGVPVVDSVRSGILSDFGLSPSRGILLHLGSQPGLDDESYGEGERELRAEMSDDSSSIKTSGNKGLSGVSPTIGTVDSPGTGAHGVENNSIDGSLSRRSSAVWPDVDDGNSLLPLYVERPEPMSKKRPLAWGMSAHKAAELESLLSQQPNFTIHTNKGWPQKTQVKVLGGSLQWTAKNSWGTIRLTEVKGILAGSQTKTMKRAVPGPRGKTCFSVLTASACLDLQGDCSEQQILWVQGLTTLASYYKTANCVWTSRLLNSFQHDEELFCK